MWPFKSKIKNVTGKLECKECTGKVVAASHFENVTYVFVINCESYEDHFTLSYSGLFKLEDFD